MKTAISVADELVAQVDRTAREMGISRSRLFSLAVESYLRKRRHAEIVEQLNRVYAGESDQPEQRTTASMKTKFRSTIKDRW